MKLYCLYNLKTFKIRYIGITSQLLKTRLYQHLNIRNKNCYKENWIKKHNFKIGIKLLKVCKSKKEARIIEKYLIRKYKDSHKLVNLQDRGFCGDKRVLNKAYCDKISNTLKLKYKNGLIIQGEKEVYVFNYKGEFLNKYKNAKVCSDTLNIPYSKIGSVCNKHVRYYKNYTFSHNCKLPIHNYFKCFDSIEKKLYLCLKKEDIPKVFNIKIFTNKLIDLDFYKNRYFVTTDNKFPILQNGHIVCNDKVYSNLNKLMNAEKNLKFTYYSEIRNCLLENIIFNKDNFKIFNYTCAWYKFGELTGNSLESILLSYNRNICSGKQ